jgi:hypothetical protein
MSEDFSKEKRFDLYKTALVELQHAVMAGRIAGAREEIANRVEALQCLPAQAARRRAASN